MGLGEYALHYVRNRQGEEVDFLISDRNTPRLLIEVKRSETQPDPSLRKFQSLLQVPAVQLVDTKGVCRVLSNEDQRIMVVDAARYLANLP